MKKPNTPTKPKGLSAKTATLHSRNRHQGHYPMAALIQDHPALQPFLTTTRKGQQSIDFSNPQAVKTLNQALLRHYYQINDWDIPANYLCPPIPGRVDYLHHLADLQPASQNNKKTNVLDIGTGANCIYPLLGHRCYNWQFVATDIDPNALKNAHNILQKNPDIQPAIELRQQTDPNAFFKGIIKKEERFTFTLCNPPFHRSSQEASAGTQRKWKNLGKKHHIDQLNFGGQKNELSYPGGEINFICRMITESKQFSQNCLWFTSLVSKADSLTPIYRTLKQQGVYQHRTIEMAQGNKNSRFIAWTFQTQI
ncbi:MAG: 23S rRNA (adenine(1618)-N(6))-methyltransferase RlmF [Candidatus Electrothrix sp. AS4_5]|nr:23S rRNA (adenine(1618)-N(6))-methyltransferase RlmF [Candidatus Electrothrix gigas]